MKDTQAFCENCKGTGTFKFISHQTEEYVEYDTDDCGQCNGTGAVAYFEPALNKDVYEACLKCAKE